MRDNGILGLLEGTCVELKMLGAVDSADLVPWGSTVLAAAGCVVVVGFKLWLTVGVTVVWFVFVVKLGRRAGGMVPSVPAVCVIVGTVVWIALGCRLGCSVGC